MKYLVLVLSIIVSLFSSGCVVTAFTGNPPPAGISVTNNIQDTVMIVRTQRDGELKGLYIANGQPAVIPVYGNLEGGRIIVTASFYDKATFNPANRQSSYLGLVTREFSVWLDGSYRYSDSWQINSYDERNMPRNKASATATTYPPMGELQIINNMAGVKVVLSSSEDQILRPLATGMSMILNVGINPTTRRFIVTAKVYSEKDEYLGYTDFQDSIDERRGYGTDRLWTIDHYTPVRAISKR